MSAPIASEDDLSLASQCLALCQTLAGQGKAFSFSITVGSTFSFSLDSKESASLPKKKKKSSPSTLRRNAVRREKFLKRKVEAPSIEEASNPIQRPPVISHTPVPFSAMEAELKSSKGRLQKPESRESSVRGGGTPLSDNFFPSAMGGSPPPLSANLFAC